MIDCRISLVRVLRSGGDHDRALAMMEELLRTWRSMPPTARTPVLATRMLETWDEFLLRLWDSGWETEEGSARRVVGLWKLNPKLGGAGATEVFEAGYQLVRSLAARTSKARRAGKLETARRMSRRLHALAFHLLSEGPDRSTTHLAVSEACREVGIVISRLACVYFRSAT